jgi:hypothetical protein
MPVTVNCIACGVEFKVKPGLLKKGRGKFCSNKCSASLRMNGIYKKCETCNNEFYLNPAELKDGKGRFCSDICRYKNTSEIRSCLNCRKTFRRTKKELERGQGKYCSQQCSNDGRKRRLEKTCLHCRKIFLVQRHRSDEAKYCSKQCRFPSLKSFGRIHVDKTGSLVSCIKCGKSFYVMPSLKNKKKYCSKECMKSELTICANPICTRKYYVQPSVLNKGYGKYCSKECRSNHLVTRLTVKCLNPSCSKLVSLYNHDFQHNRGRYCSKECKPSKKTGRILKCRGCGKDFYVSPRVASVRKNCSMRCYRTGDLTPLHKKIRHLSIYFAWRTAAFERDNYRCRDCGNKARNLEVHHVKSFKAIKLQYNIQTIQDAIRCDELWDINNGITLP